MDWSPLCEYWPELDRLRSEGVEIHIGMCEGEYEVGIYRDSPIEVEIQGNGDDLSELLGEVTSEFRLLEERVKMDSNTDYSFRDEVRAKYLESEAIKEATKEVERESDRSRIRTTISTHYEKGVVPIQVRQGGMTATEIVAFCTNLGFKCSNPAINVLVVNVYIVDDLAKADNYRCVQ